MFKHGVVGSEMRSALLRVHTTLIQNPPHDS